MEKMGNDQIVSLAECNARLKKDYECAIQDFNFATGKSVDIAIAKMIKIETKFKELFNEDLKMMLN